MSCIEWPEHHSRTDLVELIRAAATEDALGAVLASDLDVFAVRLIRTDEVRTIYERRHARLEVSQPAALAVGGLLEALTHYDEKHVALVAVKGLTRVTAIWLTQTCDSVLSAFSEDDRRVP